jgi:hypothetical protein
MPTNLREGDLTIPPIGRLSVYKEARMLNHPGSV